LLLGASVRLLTLTGPPGIGKTSLALEAAVALSRQDGLFTDGIFFVDLSPITEVDLLAATIAGTLGLKESGAGRSLDALVDYLHNRRALLVLDNFEQIIEAAPQVVALLVRCPAVNVLVTSREALNVRGEWLRQVEPLEVPAEGLSSPETIGRYQAVQLLVDRARAANPNFAITPENAQAIAGTCIALEGLPLSIELVAARARSMPFEQIVAMLDRKLSLLVNGPRDLPGRQRTLRAAIEWSHNLLGREEQLLFAWLSVFAGGCTYPAVDAVCNATGDLADVIGGIESLLNKNLLRR
jgi:predicted ATPase